MSQIQFLELLGSRERQLKRRHNNPLFASERQQVSADELQQAREQDMQEVNAFASALQELLVEVSQFSQREETDKILATKQQADRLYEQCVGLAGDHERERQGLLKLNDVIMAAIHSAAGNDALAMEELAKEQQARAIHLDMLRYPLIVDMLNPETPIEEDELVASILSEDIETIHMAMSLFDEAQHAALVSQAEEMKRDLQKRDAFEPELAAKFSAMLSAPQ